MFNDLFDFHKGQTCLVVGNGPSLKNVPNRYLEQHVTLGCNRIYLKHIPDYYVVINQLLINQFRDEINKLPCIRFARERSGVDGYQLHLIETPMFSFAPTKWVYDGHNTTFVLLQLAFFLGFTTVKLIGVDHRYLYVGEPNEVLRMEGDDPNHFNPGYFKGVSWQAPDLKVSEHAYRMAKEAYEDNGRRIVNITPGSALEVFEKEPLIWEP